MNSGAGRRGFALFAVVIGVVIIAILGTVVLVTLSGDNRQERIQRTADVLHRLVAEMDSAAGLGDIQYFSGQVKKSGPARPIWPGRLSQLYTPIVGANLACNGTTYTALGTTLTNWRGPYHLVPIRTTGHNIAPGFFADDAIVKVSTSEAYIRIQNVSLDDAKALDLTVDKTANAAAGAVQYSPTISTPVIVQYHFTDPTNTPC
jgi:type II secretory pathway pseudopilin PulG